MIKKLLKWVLIIALIPGLYVAAVLIYGTLSDYEPADIIKLKATDFKKPSTLPTTLSIVTWNIGFTGLGEESDFFYDGGKEVIQPKEVVRKNLEGVKNYLRDLNPDVTFLQEVDSSAKRSHYFNHIDEISGVLKDNYAFALNYNVDFVPLPLLEPMGGVHGGLLTFSSEGLDQPTRYSLPTQFSWPTGVFFLDRCFLSTEMQLSNGKKLVAINTHCSAYDTSGTLVSEEIKLIMDYALSRYDEGNYVIIGGDWNQCPPNYKPKAPPEQYNEYVLSNDQLPSEWRWVADPTIPTNRKCETEYDPQNSYTSVIDHFVVSPNVRVLDVHVDDLEFQFSDHQPVVLKVELN